MSQKFAAHAARRVLRLFAIATSAIAASAVSAPAPVRAAEPNVVVTIKPVHSLVTAIMAGAGTPHLLVDGAASPHTFTLKPSNAKAIQQADIFIRVSESLEPFTRRVVEALPSKVKLMSLTEAKGVTLLAQRTGATFEAHAHGGEHDHDAHDHDDHDHDAARQKEAGHDEAGHEGGGHGVQDGHIWLDPKNAQAIVAAVAAELAATYPQSAELFAKNAAEVTAKIDALSSDLQAQLAPVRGKPFIVFHDATQYFESRFEIPAAGSVTVTPDAQPSAKRLTEVRKKIASLSAACVFAEPGFQPKLVAAVTDGTSARPGTLDPEGATLTAGPELYFDLMRNLAKNISTCLAPGT